MFSMNRYLTKRIHEELPLFLQLFLWNCIAELPVPKDYLQIFRLSGAGSQQIVLHSQEVPPYEKRYQFAVPFSPVTAKIYVIAEYDANQKPYATMLFAEEY